VLENIGLLIKSVVSISIMLRISVAYFYGRLISLLLLLLG